MRLEEIPEAFVALERAGRFDYWGAPHHSLTDQQRQDLMPQRMLQVLWWDEVVEGDRTVDDIVAFERDGFMRPGLVPFARRTGSLAPVAASPATASFRPL